MGNNIARDSRAFANAVFDEGLHSKTNLKLHVGPLAANAKRLHSVLTEKTARN